MIRVIPLNLTMLTTGMSNLSDSLFSGSLLNIGVVS
jgi:hypothetical protein